MPEIPVADALLVLDKALEEVPNRPAVFLIWPKQGEPYLGKTSVLRRRLLRLLRDRETPSRLLNLRQTAQHVEYWLTGSKLESAVLMYERARRHFPKTYLDVLRLRMPPYVKLILTNEFPRSQITTQLGRAPAAYFGPFRTRASAERFESQFLDLFQMRRCQEDLVPSPSHPGCIYGEMGMCLRPCQEVVGAEEYRHEVDRVVDFLRTGGRSLINAATAARERFSADLDFEQASRQHKCLEKIQEVLRLCDDLARDVDLLSGVAVTGSTEPQAVELWFIYNGAWQGSRRVTFEAVEGKSVSLDQKLRETAGTLAPAPQSVRQRQEYLAILARWYYSTWRDGEWFSFDSLENIPYRKLVHAISRVAQARARE
jgi:excinuclease UvrABC nuclease subunit